MPEYRRAFQPGGTFFFTLVTEGRAPIFAEAMARRQLHQAISTCRAIRPFTMEAVVLLPDHLHLILRLAEGDANFSRHISAVKSHFTRLYLGGGGLERPRSSSRLRQRSRGVWQRRFWEHLIRDDVDLDAHMDYIHYNPVKHGLASCPHAWSHSTFIRHVQLRKYDADWLCCCNGKAPEPPSFDHLPRGIE